LSQQHRRPRGSGARSASRRVRRVSAHPRRLVGSESARPKAQPDCYAEPSNRAMSRLSLLVDLAALLTREVDLDALLGAACERVAEALGADRASIWLVDAEHGDLVTRVALLPEVP